MTEIEWLACTDPTKMLRFLGDRAGSRKLRLFGCACCRQVWDLLSEDCFRDAVVVAERFVDDQASRKELAATKSVSGAALERNGLTGLTGPRYCASGSAWSCTRGPQTAAMYPLWVFTDKDQRRWEGILLREIFGDPFRPSPPLPPAVFAWNDGIVSRIAQAVYEERQMPAGTLDPARLAILADALLDAGCDDEALIGHCRSEGPHVRGCWAVDLILGKE